MFCSSTGYLAESGTSMASPHVAGVAALVIAQGVTDTNGNGRTNDEVASQMCGTATAAGDLSPGDPSYASSYGCGIVNALFAVNGPPPPPVANFTSPAAGATVTSTTDSATVTWTESSGDSGAVTGRTLTQQRGAVITPGTCNGVTWTTRWTSSAYRSPFMTSGYASGYCYRYMVTLTNGSGGSASATSGNLLVDIPPPPNPAATFTSPAAGATVTSTSDTATITWTESSGDSGPVSGRSLTQQRGAVVTPGTCTGVTWTTRWTSSAYTSPFTTTGYASGYCYRYTLTLTNGSGGSVTVTSGTLLVAIA
jgi:hypothetical protein